MQPFIPLYFVHAIQGGAVCCFVYTSATLRGPYAMPWKTPQASEASSLFQWRSRACNSTWGGMQWATNWDHFREGMTSKIQRRPVIERQKECLSTKKEQKCKMSPGPRSSELSLQETARGRSACIEVPKRAPPSRFLAIRRPCKLPLHASKKWVYKWKSTETISLFMNSGLEATINLLRFQGFSMML